MRDRHSSSFVPGRIPKKNKKKSRDAPLHNHKDEIEILLLQANTNLISPNREQYGYGYDAYLYTNDGETLESEFSSKGVKIIKSLNLTDYQNQEFVIEDCDGRWIAFGLKIKI